MTSPASSLSVSRFSRAQLLAALVLASSASLAARAQEAGAELAEVPEVSTLELDAMFVFGDAVGVYDLPGSGAFIDTEQIRDANYGNVNRILARVPGVYVREEDGFGNFPNISIRGGDGTRSEKATVMEDGILTAPATYSAPSAYYSPQGARMSGVEVLKGSSQVAFGPHTTGGVINYTSTPIPEEAEGYAKTTFGSDRTFLQHLNYGDTIDLGGGGRFGYVIEFFRQGSDGFREIDSGGAFEGSDSTGFEVNEPMLKFSYEPDTAVAQRIEFKYGATNFDADETYVGLTEDDYAANPLRRYAGTYLDHMHTEHDRSYLKWAVEPSDTLSFEFAGYFNEFERDWYKIRKTGGESIHKVLADPSGYADAYSILQLESEGELGIRHNSRSYEMYGFQATGNWQVTTGSIEHDLNFGTRIHHDSIRRFQQDDEIVVGADGSLSVEEGEPGSGGNRFQETDALAIWIEDSISFGALTLRPGIRYETIDGAFTDYESDSSNTVTAEDSGSTDYFAPGIGFTYDLSDIDQVFGGVFKGASVPSPRNSLKSGVEVEESMGYELGIRRRADNGMTAELTGFFTDFDNLIGAAAGLGADGESATNAGEAEVYGVEFAVNQVFNEGATISVPAYFSSTWTDATLSNALSEGGADDIWAGGEAGAEIPYVPEFKLAAGLGLAAEKWGVNLDLSYTSESFGTALNVDEPVTSSRQGKIDEAFLVDLSAHYFVREDLKLIAGIQNVLDEEYVVSRIPDGPRSGAPSHFYLGAELKF